MLVATAGCKDGKSNRGGLDDGGYDDGSVGDASSEGGTMKPDGGGDGGLLDGGDAGPNPGPGDGGMDGSMVVPDSGPSTPDTGPISMPDTGVPDGGQTDGGGTGTIASLSAVSFGLAPCGGDAPEAKTLTLTNSGTAPVTYTATLSSSSAFSLAGATNGAISGTVAAGATSTLTVNASAVATTATAGQPITASLTITTNLPAPNASIVIPVTVVPQGAALRISPNTNPSALWTSVQLNQAGAALPIEVRNAGNAAANVTLTQPAAMQFSLLSGTNPAGTFMVPAATDGTPGSIALTANFTPTVVGPVSATAALAVTGPVCNGGTPSATQISLSGTGTGTGFIANATAPLEPTVNCGATGAALPSATITVSNYTAGAIAYTAALQKAGSSDFTLSSTGESVASGASTTFEVTLKETAAPSTAVPTTVLTDTVVITPPAGSALSPILIPLSTTVQGAVLTFEPINPFNGATAESPQPQAVVVSNRGNLPASPTLTVAGTDAALFTLTDELTPASIPAGSIASPGQSTITASFAPPVGDAATKNATVVLTPAATDVICGAAPVPLALTGTATTAGFRLDSPSNGTVAVGDNGFVDCPAGGLSTAPGNLTAAAPFNVKFTNTGSIPLNWTATLPSGNFTADALSGMVAPGAEGTIVVTPLALPYPADVTTNAYGDVLTITTNIVGDQPHPVTLTQTARGAILTTTGYATGFGEVNSAFTGALTPAFGVSNTGNTSADITLTSTITAGTGVTTPRYEFNGGVAAVGVPGTSTLQLGPNESTDISGVFTPGADRADSSVSTAFTTTDPVCSVRPAPVVFTGTGTNADVNFSGAGTLSFSVDECNTPPNAPRGIVATNSGNEEFLITSLSLALGTDSPFNAYIGAPNITMAEVPRQTMGTPGTAVITVAPKFIPAGTPDGTSLTDTLTIEYTFAGIPQTDEVVVISQPVQCGGLI